ncbi:MAG: cation transporter [Flavobacteriales bacterium]|nr:cation transporter [Bacteroidota bacterium]MCB9241463.1 cation transporter [Flavobacteriales bacterium]
MSERNTGIEVTRWSLIGNLVLTLVKGVSGWLGNSYALIADAIESMTDVFASLLVLFGLKYASKPADDNHPYGHGRIEPLITFFVVLILVLSAATIAYHSIHNIVTPHKPPQPWTIGVLVLIILWKEVAYRKVDQTGRDLNSTALRAEAWHHRSDAITSFTALIGITIAVLMGEGYEAADDWAALFASVFILYNSYRIFRPAFSEFMDEHTHDELVGLIRQYSTEVHGVIYTEKCLIRKLGNKYFVDLHAVVNGALSVRDGHEIGHNLKDHLLRQLPELEDVLIHIEPDDLYLSEDRLNG